MTNKEINRESGRIFGALLLPSWAHRSQEDQEDYGVDGEIEVTTPEDQATGFLFKLQLKGTEHAEYDQTGQLVYSEASVERFTYYMHRLKVPVVYVVCDIKKGVCFWSRVQGQPQIEAALKIAADKGQQTFTLKFPATRAFERSEACAAAVLEAVASAGDTIALRAIKGLTGAVVGKHLVDDPDIAATEKKFRLFAGLAGLEVLSTLLRADDLDGALEKGKALLEGEAEEPALRIQAGVLFANAYAKLLRRANKANAAFDGARFRLGVADAMLRICRKPNCDARMRLYARVYARASRMQLNARILFAVAVSEKVQRQQGQTLAGPITTIERIRATERVTRDFRRIQILFLEAIKQKFYSLVPYLVDDVLEVAFPFTNALRVAEQKEVAGAYEEALWQGVPAAVQVAKVMLEPEVAYALLLSMGLKVVGLAATDPSAAGKFINRYEQELLKERPLGRAAEIVGHMRALLAAATKEREKPASLAERREYYEQQAAALGIDLSNPQDRIAEIVRIGLEDLDPTRVARHCRHIHLRHGPAGLPAEMLGLPTAGSKSIMCLKHGHAIQGLKLDDIYAMFARATPWTPGQMSCDKCPDVSPHPPGWEWSDEWAAEQAARYKQLRGQKAADKK